MNKDYITPAIEIIEFVEEIQTLTSTVIDYPWSRDEDFEYFE